MNAWFKRGIVSLFISILLAGLFGTRRALALEPPLSEEELHGRSELIVDADVLGAVLTAVACDANWERRQYRAWLLVRSTRKGPVQPDSTLEVAWMKRTWRSDEPEPTRGSYEPAYFPGDRVRAFLVWSSKRYAWRTLHWNGQNVITQGGKLLPQVVGQVVFKE